MDLLLFAIEEYWSGGESVGFLGWTVVRGEYRECLGIGRSVWRMCSSVVDLDLRVISIWVAMCTVSIIITSSSSHRLPLCMLFRFLPLLQPMFKDLIRQIS